VVLLPAPQTPEAKPSDAQPGAQAQSAATRHILLVEDEDDIRRVASRILLGAGFRVTEASDGEEALDIARRERFDLLLSDMVMPKIGGVRLAAELGPLNPSMRVLFMSGYSVELGAGMDCIQKPFEPSALIERVQAALG
jgi:CheY-like chemotaxis protein